MIMVIFDVEGRRAVGNRRGGAYVDVGTLHGYRSAVRVFEQAVLPRDTGEPPDSSARGRSFLRAERP
jgi:hypothetical protein